MNRRFRPAVLLGFAWLALMPLALAGALSVATFFRAPAYPQMVLSPSGGYVAALYPANGTTNLAVLDVNNLSGRPLTAFQPPSRVISVGWDTDDRLIYHLESPSRFGAPLHDLVAVNRDGKNPLFLTSNQNPDNHFPASEELVDFSQDDPKSILMASDAENEDFPSVYEVNTVAAWHEMASAAAVSRTKFATRRNKIVPAPGRKCDYVTDNTGVVRVCITTETDNSSKVLYRAGPKADWTQLTQYSSSGRVLEPIGFAPDNHTLYVFSNRDRDTIALFEYDPDAAKLGRLLFETPGADLHDTLWSADHRRLLGVSYADTRSRVYYFDAKVAQLQKDLHEVFPGDTLTLQNFSADGKRVLVLVTNDRSPGKYYLYDETKQSVEQIAARAPWIDPKQMGEVKPIHYPARDGLEIHGYLTLPPGKAPKRLPLIVYPHGGPYAVRDVDGFNADVQFFASRGYAVLQMNFRGSGGYGTRFLEAGTREWGGKMQDDVTDGLKWAVAEGIADEARVCIFGASYGGYAALMGAALAPELYKCVISYAGVTDLESMFQPRIIGRIGYRDRTPEELVFISRVVGDRKDADYLHERSPAWNAAKIRAPVFIAHGELDPIVPFSNAQSMKSALEREHKTFEFFSRPDEGHGFEQEANEIALFTQIEAFLKKYDPTD
ncbi:MAG TPA: S9 family peptidase [Steroidobacteraceae bacterium]|jgi:dipeptidyl aminopeptidase/acylaminoacyl peptidase